MLYTYIISTDKVKKYFPETESTNETRNGSTVVRNDLVCIKSNKWVDIPEKDKFIPFSFRSDCVLDDERTELMVRYIENVTSTKGVFFSILRNLGDNVCEYRCYIGDDSLYVSEADSYDIKKDLAIFENGDVFITDDKRAVQKETDGKIGTIIFGREDVGERELIFPHQHEIETMTGKSPSHLPRQWVDDIEDEKLPVMSIPKKNLPALVISLLEKEDPLYTPRKISQSLSRGGIHFGSYDLLKEELKKASPLDMMNHVTTDPHVFLLTLRVNDVPYIASENDGITEIDYVEIPEDPIDPILYDDMIIKSCKNHAELRELDPELKLNILVHDDHGIVIDPQKMEFTNKYTGNILPKNIIHTHAWSGLELQPGFDPHRHVHIDVPVTVTIEKISDHICSIVLRTYQEVEYLEDEFHCHLQMGEEETLKHLIRKLWRKGYLLDDYGLTHAHYYDEMKPGHIQKPWWFQAKDENQARDLIKFISIL